MYPIASRQARENIAMSTVGQFGGDQTNELSAIEERVRQYLIEQERKADPSHPFQATVTYGNLCSAIDPEQHYWSWPRFRGIGKVLLHISTFEHGHGRPLLSALVV